MSDWIEMPKTQSQDAVQCVPCDDDDEWKYRVYIPLPSELVSQVKVGTDVEIVLKGVVKRLSISEDDKESSGEICLRVKAAKLPKAKSAMEDYASSLLDEDE